MKKKIISIVLMSVLLAGTVSASSINGDYKGNPIVKVKSYGQVLPVEDAPAIIYDDRTMVPIYMLKSLGADITWNENDFSVDVKIGGNKETNKSFNEIKFLNKTSEQYRKLMAVGNLMYAFYQSVFFDLKQLAEDNNSTGFSDKKTVLSNIILSYNNNLDSVDKIINDSKQFNLSLTDMNSILNNYNKAIDEYKNAIDLMTSYTYGEPTDEIVRHLDAGFNIGNSGLSSATFKYFEYYDKVQNY